MSYNLTDHVGVSRFPRTVSDGICWASDDLFKFSDKVAPWYCRSTYVSLYRFSHISRVKVYTAEIVSHIPIVSAGSTTIWHSPSHSPHTRSARCLRFYGRLDGDERRNPNFHGEPRFDCVVIHDDAPGITCTPPKGLLASIWKGNRFCTYSWIHSQQVEILDRTFLSPLTQHRISGVSHLWCIASLAVTIIPIFISPFILIILLLSDFAEAPGSSIVILCTLTYVFSRLVLLRALSLLRDLPSTAFIAIDIQLWWVVHSKSLVLVAQFGLLLFFPDSWQTCRPC